MSFSKWTVEFVSPLCSVGGIAPLVLHSYDRLQTVAILSDQWQFYFVNYSSSKLSDITHMAVGSYVYLVARVIRRRRGEWRSSACLRTGPCGSRRPSSVCVLRSWPQWTTRLLDEDSSPLGKGGGAKTLFEIFIN